MRKNPVLTLLLATHFIVLETTMLNADIGIAKKNAEKKRHPQVINVLKESIGATTIIKRILDLGVSLKVGKLLLSASAVEKQLRKAIFEDEAIQFFVNTLESAEVLETFTLYSWYSIK